MKVTLSHFSFLLTLNDRSRLQKLSTFTVNCDWETKSFKRKTEKEKENKQNKNPTTLANRFPLINNHLHNSTVFNSHTSISNPKTVEKSDMQKEARINSGNSVCQRSANFGLATLTKTKHRPGPQADYWLVVAVVQISQALHPPFLQPCAQLESSPIPPPN